MLATVNPSAMSPMPSGLAPGGVPSSAFRLDCLAPHALAACVAAYVVAHALGTPSASARTAMALVLPVLVTWRLPRDWPADRSILAASWIALAMFGWTLLGSVRSDGLVDIGLGRCAALAGAIVLTWSVICSPIPAARMIAVVGASASFALAVAAIGMLATGLPHFGAGNINHLLGACSPPLVGWAAWIIGSAVQRRTVPIWQWLACASALAVFMTLAFLAVPGMPRRGALVVLAAVCTWSIADQAWRRSRRWCALALTACALALVAWGPALIDAVVGHRDERLLLYGAGLEATVHALPWGAGPFAMLAAQDLDGEYCRHLTAAGLWALHAHNEVVESFLSGGLPGGALFLVLIAIVAWRALRVADPALRAAACAIAIALAVHAMTDNGYDLPAGLAWAAILCGVVLRCPPRAPHTARAVPGLRACAWALAGFSLIGALHEWQMLTMGADASPQRRLRALAASWQAEELAQQWLEPLRTSVDAGDFATGAAVLRVVGPKLRWSGGLLGARYQLERETASAYREQLLWACQNIAASPVDENSWRSALTAGAGVSRTDADAVRFLLDVLHRRPFDRAKHAELRDLLSLRPDLAAHVPPRVLTRMAYACGDPAMAAPGFPAPDSVEAGADLQAQLAWAGAHQWPDTELRPPLERLLARYGDVPDVHLLAMTLARDAPPGAYAWLLGERHLVQGTELIPESDLQRFLASITTHGQAAATWPLLRRLAPRIAEQALAGDAVKSSDADAGRIRDEFRRIANLAH